MRTAVDSSVLLDVFGADDRFGEASHAALRGAYDSGSLIACDVVWAEVRAHFESDEEFAHAMSAIGVQFVALSEEAAATAGAMWARRRRRATIGPSRLVADYLVGAHALHQAEALLTRDRGFYSRDFKGLRVIDPTK